MSRNVELKARWSRPEEARRRARELGAALLLRERQEDTYFPCPRGRLKLRRRWLLPGPGADGEAAGSRERGPAEEASQLIWYLRPDAGAPRKSDYRLLALEGGDELVQVLSGALGVLARVVKDRTIYLRQGVRIHVDLVEGRGAFLELEAVVDESCDDAAAEAKVRGLVEAFGIVPEMLVGVSYSDLPAGEAG